jgi:hypothetical protein
MTLKELVEQKFGTINKFVDVVHNFTTISRTHLYKLINIEVENPGYKTLLEFSTISGIPLQKILELYKEKSGIEIK